MTKLDNNCIPEITIFADIFRYKSTTAILIMYREQFFHVNHKC